MLNWNLLAVAFTSIMGSVSGDDIGKSLKLMGFGMLGIFVVMLVIYLVIFILNKTTTEKKIGK